MASTSKALIAVPTPAEVDALAISYDNAKAKVLDATLAAAAAMTELAPLKQKCIDLVSKFGSAYATKSKLLHGLKWEIMGTFGSSTSIDAAAVEILRLNLVDKKQTRLLKRLFEGTTRWALRSTARAEMLKTGVADDVRALFAACEVTLDNSPSIKAREKQPA